MWHVWHLRLQTRSRQHVRTHTIECSLSVHARKITPITNINSSPERRVRVRLRRLALTPRRGGSENTNYIIYIYIIDIYIYMSIAHRAATFTPNIYNIDIN